jgi:hypothetical protein
MAKTNPIGVRFRPEVLEKLKKEHGIDSPQAALVFLERFYCQHWELTKDVTAPLRKQHPKETIDKALELEAQKEGSDVKVEDLGTDDHQYDWERQLQQLSKNKHKKS